MRISILLLSLLFTSASVSAATCSASYTYTGDPTINFTDGSVASPGSVNSWFWDFGDGNISGTQNPSHTYAANGTYLVCLSIQTTDSCTSVYCDTVTISGVGAVSCNASFTSNTASDPTLLFTDGSVASPGSVNSWFWDFGDGNLSGTQNPSHTYAANGTYLVCLSIQTTDSCTSVYCDTVTISGVGAVSCNASFTSNTASDPTVFFTDGSVASPGSVNTWFWDFGDGNIATTQNPSHTYAANGTYLVCLSIQTSDSCFSTYCDTISIAGVVSCNASFTSNTASDPTVFFTDGSVASPGSVNTWFWDFGDGNIATTQNPSHTYAANGTYLVCLSIQTSDSCFSTYCDTISIAGVVSCNASFTSNTASDPTVFFTDGSVASPGSVNTWFWDFGDGNIATTQNPSHTYAANGTYLVCLSIQTSDSCFSTYCDTISIAGVVSCNASFTSNTASDPTVFFTDGSVASPGSVNTWFWDFGDGNIATTQNPSHTYAANGTYLVCLSIQTSDSCFSTYCDTISIAGVVSCNASFTSNTASDPTVFFTDGSVASPGSVNTWFWDFGDGNIATTQNPSHTYAANGTYLVCLSIQTSDSCFSTYCDTISIAGVCPPPSASFTDSTTGLSASFVDGSSGTVTSWSWDFGDGNTSTLQNPSHTYASPGTYTVCLIASGACGSDSTCNNIIISCAGPTAGFTSTATNFVASFTDASSTTGAATYSWSFGDGNTSTLMDPTHVYASNGSYVVCLTVTDVCGSSTVCDTLFINCPPPVASFTSTSTDLTATFTDASTGNSISSWSWNFGDGNASSIQNPSNTYAASGVYYVCLTVNDSCGSSTYCDSVTVIGVGMDHITFDENQITVYPNPSNGIVTVSVDMNEARDLNFMITDLSGREVYHDVILDAHQTTQTLELTNLSDGVYYMRFTSGKEQVIKRLVIVK